MTPEDASAHPSPAPLPPSDPGGGIDDPLLEMGEALAVIREYLKTLSGSERAALAKAIGERYGILASEVSAESLEEWGAGKRTMSGQVARRMLEFLPRRMPLAKKYELAEKIWLHFGKASHSRLAIPADAPLEQAIRDVSQKLDSLLAPHVIPAEFKARFKWLESPDIRAEEALLNHLRSRQKDLALDRVRLELPLLQRQWLEHPETSLLLRMGIQVHNHRLTLEVGAPKNAQGATARP